MGYDIDVTSPLFAEIENVVELFLEKKQIQEAKETLEAAKKKDPSLPPVEVLMAKLFARGGNGPQAQLLLEQAVSKTASEDPEAYLLLAEVVFRLGH
ncbi:MAG: hypothetical protein KDA42_19285, partial [Planctomycetales bacterium]|nr:hypothetical protein [Planctomycetales bacterium]